MSDDDRVPVPGSTLKRRLSIARAGEERNRKASAESLQRSRERATPPKRTPLRSVPVERDWSDAIAKRDREAVCRNCGDDWRRHPGRRLEAAHTAAREYDRPKPCPLCDDGLIAAPALAEFLDVALLAPCPLCAGAGSLEPNLLWVDPDDIVTLCGPATDTATCHGRLHRHELDLLPLLSTAEQLRVVAHEGSIGCAETRTMSAASLRGGA